MLPKAFGSNTPSVAEHILSKAPPAALVSPSSLRRRINASLVLAPKSGREPQSLIAEVDKLCKTAPDFWDTAGYVNEYKQLLPLCDCSVEYSRKIPLFSANPRLKPKIWARHQAVSCQHCRAFYADFPSIEEALQSNETNPCYHADILAWIAGQWRLPLKEPIPPSRLDNYASLTWSPTAMEPEVRRMVDEWEILRPARPTVIHPGMAVIRDGELQDALRILRGVGDPCPYFQKSDIEKINIHISEALSKLPPRHPARANLKPIKVRFCLDTSKLLNSKLHHWPFSVMQSQC